MTLQDLWNYYHQITGRVSLITRTVMIIFLLLYTFKAPITVWYVSSLVYFLLDIAQYFRQASVYRRLARSTEKAQKELDMTQEVFFPENAHNLVYTFYYTKITLCVSVLLYSLLGPLFG